MLEIDMRMFPTIAEQKTEHSWMLPILQAAKNWDWDEDEKAEDLMDQWIEEQATKLHPESQRAERVIRTTLLYLLENQAISKVKETHPTWAQYLPEILTPKEAVQLAKMEMCLSKEDEEAAIDLLSQMQNGSLQPSRELLGEVAQEKK